MKNYRRIAMLMCSVGLMLLLTGVTYSFFNYTKTGTANSFETGTINFSVDDGESISLTNVFPMTASEASEANIDTLTIGISGNTTYSSGEEFLISIVDVTKINNKEIPISYIATYTPTTGNSIGTEEDDYFTERESKSTNIYLLNETGKVKEDKQVLVGFIKGGTAGIDGTLTIKAYVDADRIAITDTPEANPDWVAGRQVLSTTEWNSLQGNNAISFKIKAESYTKLWVEEPEADNVTPESCFEKKFATVYTLNTNMTQTELNDCINYISSLNYTFDDNGTAEDFCSGTGRVNGFTFPMQILSNWNFNYNYLESHNIVASESGVRITSYDTSCGGDLVFPRKMSYTRILANPNMTPSEINECVDFLANTHGLNINTNGGETFEAYCAGTGTSYGTSFQDGLDKGWYRSNEIEYMETHNIVTASQPQKYPVLVIGDTNNETFADYSLALTSLVFNSNLKVIANYAFYGPRLSSSINIITIPESVIYIGDRSMLFNYDVYDPNRVIEYDILGKSHLDGHSINDTSGNGNLIIQYNGTCAELYSNSFINYSGNVHIVYGPDNQQYDVITTDTNYCKVYADTGGD